MELPGDDSVKIVQWWGKLKDLDKVYWCYAKEKNYRENCLW